MYFKYLNFQKFHKKSLIIQLLTSDYSKDKNLKSKQSNMQYLNVKY